MSKHSDVIYKINKEKRTVVCIINGCEELASDRMYKYARHIEQRWLEFSIKRQYIGIAKCSPEDEWDEEKGKKLALIRAKRKRCRDINKMIYRVIDMMKREIADLEKYGIHKLPDENEVLS